MISLNLYTILLVLMTLCQGHMSDGNEDEYVSYFECESFEYLLSLSVDTLLLFLDEVEGRSSCY